MRLALLTGLLCVTLGGCRYHERDLTCDPVAVGCGGGEACAVSNATGEVTCSCGDVVSVGRACGSGTSCAAATCVVNAPPVAVISRTVDGVLRVASNSSAALSGRESTDPEGGSLTYAWSFAGVCGVPPDALDTQDIALDTTGITDDCTVTLTVTDDFGEAAIATAAIKARAVGAYVATVDQDANCLAAYDPANEDPQGTYDHPFCELAPAINAAVENSLPEVSIALNALLTLNGTLDVADLTIAGGYTMSATAPWTRADDETNRSRIITNIDLGGEPIIHLSAGTTALVNLEIASTTLCANGCTAIAVSGTNATLTRSNITASTFPYSPVTAIAVREGTGSTSLTVSGGFIQATNGETTNGLTATGAVTVILRDTARVFAVNSVVRGIGVKLGNGTVLEVHGGTIGAVGSGSTGTATQIGLQDGSNLDIDGVATCAPPKSSCNHSARVTLDNALVSSQGDKVLYGAVLLGSTAVTIGNASEIVAEDGSQSVALVTMDVTSLTTSNTAIRATSAGTSASTNFVLGLRDGSYDTGPFVTRNGSPGLAFGENTVFTANAKGFETIESVSAALLNGTTNASFTKCTLEVTGESVPVNVAAGATTHGTVTTTFDQSTFRLAGVIANWRLDAFADGCGTSVDTTSVCGSNYAGSNGLSFTGNDLSGELRGTTAGGSKRVCALFAGTTDATITGNTVRCTGETGAATDEVNAGIWLIATTAATLEHNHVYADTVLAGANNAHTWYVGILDGLFPNFDNDQNALIGGAASGRLVLNRNEVRIGKTLGPSSYGVGVWYRGFKNARALYNTTIDLGTLHDYGIILDQAVGDVQLNTIRATQCDSAVAACSGYGVGVYILKGATHESVLRGNLFTAEALDSPSYGTYVVNHRASGSTKGGLTALTYNQFGISGGVNGASQLFYGTRTDANDFPGDPSIGLTSTSTESVIAATLNAGADVTQNQASSPTFCGSLASVQNTDAGNNLVPVASLTSIAAQVSTDYRDTPRDTNSSKYDAGATERGTVTCTASSDF